MLKKLAAVFVICVCAISGCGHSRGPDVSTSPSKGDGVIEITKHAVSNDTLLISYRVTNGKDYAIWVCEGIDEVGRANITMKGSVLYFQLFSHLLYPEGILLYVPPIAFYSKLSPGERMERTILAALPISEQSRHVHPNRDGGTGGNQRVRRRAIVQIGYLTQQSINDLGPYVRSLPQDRLEVAVLEAKVNESIIEMSISEIRIPVLVRADGSKQTDAQLQREFAWLLRRWEKHMDEVSFSSRYQDYLDCQAYRDIVALGRPALPLVVDAMRRGGDIWLFLAVRDITGVTPADLEEGLDDEGNDRGWNLEHVRGLYIQWWDTEGLREFGEKRSQPRNDNQGERPL